MIIRWCSYRLTITRFKCEFYQKINHVFFSQNVLSNNWVIERLPFKIPLWALNDIDTTLCGRDHMVVGFTTTCAISTYYHFSCELESHSWRDVLDTTLCDKICPWLTAGWWFSPDTPDPVSSTNKTDHQDIIDILLKVVLNTINDKP